MQEERVKCKEVRERLYTGVSKNNKSILKHLEKCDKCKSVARMIEITKNSIKETTNDRNDSMLAVSLATMREMDKPTLINSVRELALHPIPVYQVAVAMLLLFSGVFIGTRPTSASHGYATEFSNPANAEVVVTEINPSQLVSWRNSEDNIGLANSEDSLLILVKQIN